MKYLSLFCSLLLLASLSACSDTGSSDEPESTTSTNTIPPENNTTGDGTSAEPSNDQSTTADGSDTATGDAGNGTDDDSDADGAGSGGGTDTDDGADTDGGTDTDNGTDIVADTDGGSDSDAGNDSEGGSDSTPDNDTDAGDDMPTGSDNGNTDTDGDNTGDTTHPDDNDLVIDPDSSLGQLQSRIKNLTGRTLIALNQSLSQGEMLSAQQEQCLGSYDPGIGEPLLSIDCDQPLATGEVPIFASIASLQDTPECRASLQNANADECALDQAQLSVSPIFVIPETGRPQLKQAGATLSYNIVQDRLTLENLDPPLTGAFFCEYDLSNGNAVGGDPGGNCYDQLNRICDLIDEHLAIEN